MQQLLNRIAQLDAKRADKHVQQLTQDDFNAFGLKDFTFHDYQLEGISWIINAYNMSHGVILGDEMGLGKTLQAIGFLSFICNGRKGSSKGNAIQALVISPLSVVRQWETEMQRALPEVERLTFAGFKEDRELFKKQFRKATSDRVILITYETILSEFEWLSKLKFDLAIIDEAHRLKNIDADRRIAVRKFDCSYVLALTGTPIQNNLRELYSLLALVAPSIFSNKVESVDAFEAYYKPLEKRSELRNWLPSFLLRRTKERVLPSAIPGLRIVTLSHGLSLLQKNMYRSLLQRNLEVQGRELPRIIAHLRKCVCHPYLFPGVEPEPFAAGEHLVTASGKLGALDGLLRYVKRLQHRVLVFSQFTRFLDIVQDYMDLRGYLYERLDGAVRSEERYAAIHRFNASGTEQEEPFVFLLSTKAGGVGLNLASADTVVILDSDWNPQNDLQAIARAHRIGQSRPVRVVRLVAHDTIEEVIVRRAEYKSQLSNAVLDEMGPAATQKNLDDLKTVLGFGLAKLFANEKIDGSNNSTVESIKEKAKAQDHHTRSGSDSPESNSSRQAEEEQQNATDEFDFEAILGQSSAGVWQPIETDSEASSNQQALSATSAKRARRSSDADTHAPLQTDDKRSSEEATDQKLYVFEGIDYTIADRLRDQAVLESLREIALAKVINESDTKRTRKPRDFGETSIEETSTSRAKTQQRRILTKSERDAQFIEREQSRRSNKTSNFSSFYVSKALLEPTFADGRIVEEQSEEESDDMEENGEESDRLQLAIGDVTKPLATGDHVITMCVDNSGEWSERGVFAAITRLSDEPQNYYESASEANDLALGDAHIIEVEREEQSTKLRVSSNSNSDAATKPKRAASHSGQARMYVCLLVAETRNKKTKQSTGVNMLAFELGLARLAIFAKRHGCSVHMPRIGYAAPQFDWYAAERLIRKRLAERGVDTVVYYYRRSPAAEARSDTQKQTVVRLRDLPNLFTDAVVLFDCSSIEEQTLSTLQRYIIAYNGEVVYDATDTQSISRVTHVVTNSEGQVPSVPSLDLSKVAVLPLIELIESIRTGTPL